MSKVKGFFLKNGEKEGELKLDLIKVILTTVITVLIGALFTWGRWVTIQAYEVATNKNNLIKTAEQFEKDTCSNKALIDKNNTVHHMRHNKLDAKYDAKMTEMHRLLMQTNTLIVEMLVQKNKEVQLKKQEVDMQQQQQAPRWPISPHNNN